MKTTYGMGYGLTLYPDRSVNVAAAYIVHIQRRSRVLSSEEYEGVLHLLDSDRFRSLVAARSDLAPQYYGDGLGEITACIDSGEGCLKLVLDYRLEAHMDFFNELEEKLQVRPLRCPFVVTIDNKKIEACHEVEVERRHRLEGEKRQ